MTYRKKWFNPMGTDLLHDPMLNKGTAFTKEERRAFKLEGLLPPKILTQQEQVDRIVANFHEKPDDLEKFVYLMALQDRNERLFYRVVLDNLEEMMPIIYTPTVGEACRKYGRIFRRPRGVYLSLEDRGEIRETLKNWPESDVRVIVVTDGERILGLGDLGAYGMGIPVGKLALYTLCGGIDPGVCLPITLDVGTNNRELLNDPLYIGTQQERIRGDEYDAFIQEFLDAVVDLYPHALVQFEDFGRENAFRLLERYRDKLCTFNDDIQGTGSVALAGVLSALRISKGALEEQRFLFAGAGEAGLGIADAFTSALVSKGLSPDEARRRCWFVDSEGLVVATRNGLEEHKQPYAHDHPFVSDFHEAVGQLKPTGIIGVSAQPGLFSPTILSDLAELNDRPIVFALSNPTSKCECTAEDAYTHTGGRAIFASGSPFAPFEFEGRRVATGQGNNAYIFPGVGLGALACSASRVTDSMFHAAAKTLADQVTESSLAQGCIYPPISLMRTLSKRIAVTVMRTAHEEGLAKAHEPDDPEALIDALMFDPSY